jgi:hypothetical protein
MIHDEIADGGGVTTAQRPAEANLERHYQHQQREWIRRIKIRCAKLCIKQMAKRKIALDLRQVKKRKLDANARAGLRIGGVVFGVHRYRWCRVET